MFGFHFTLNNTHSQVLKWAVYFRYGAKCYQGWLLDPRNHPDGFISKSLMCTAKICPSPKINLLWIVSISVDLNLRDSSSGSHPLDQQTHGYVNHVLKSYLNCSVSNVHKVHHETYTHRQAKVISTALSVIMMSERCLTVIL